ncbi:unnamed protein product [Haemonchus placei]|uniref:Uncharacterized protein n=1 Tax=Haemonchus placei TaxID=6290 RepID=A0A3P8AMT9_HAEPC|nr:unnamed protein product [Haemonchus placei]
MLLGQEEIVQEGQEEAVRERQEEIVQERQEAIVRESTFIELQPEPREVVMLHSDAGQEDEDALDTLTALAERLRVIAGDIDVPLEAAGIISRPDVPTHGRPKMRKSELYSVRCVD